MLPIEMKNATGTYLDDLDEYCLLEIFSQNILTAMDLCSLAETCKRFKQIIQRVFAKGFNITSPDSFNHEYTFECSYSKFKHPVSRQDVKRILKNFRPNLRNLSIRQMDSVNFISSNCFGVKINRLEIFGQTCMQPVCRKLKSIFRRGVTRISLQCCNLNDFTSKNFKRNSLIEIRIIDSTEIDSSAFLKSNFRNLERFTFREDIGWYERDDDNTGPIAQFISRHKRLKVLDLVGSSIDCSKEIVDAIGNNCTELEELTLKCYKRSKIPFDDVKVLGLPKLRTLDVLINVKNYIQIISLLRASFSLETVKLYFDDTIPLQIFEVLSQQQHLHELILKTYIFERIPWTMLTQLRKLRLTVLTGKVRATNLLHIMRQLTNLEEFHLYDNWGKKICGLKRKHFAHIVKILK